MNTSEIRDIIEKHDGYITLDFVAGLSTKLGKHCQKEARKQMVAWNQILYLLLYPNTERKCKHCGKPTKFKCFSVGFPQWCSAKCKNTDPSFIDQTKKSMNDRYGGRTFQSKTLGKQARATMVSRYGVHAMALDPATHKRQQKTCLKNYGVKQIITRKDIVEQTQAKNLENRDKIIAKREATFIERYGFRHPSQVREIHEKQQRTGFKIKQVTIQGKTFKLRGYEDTAVRFLVKKLGIDVGDIVNSHAEGMLSVTYVDKDGVIRVYHPDFLINGRTMVEVKSEYTAGLAPRSSLYSPMVVKLRAAKAAGFNVKLVVVKGNTGKGGVVVINNPTNKTKAEIKALVYG